MMLPLYQMKQVRVIVLGKHRSFIMDLLDQVHATGYTVLCHRTGSGPFPVPPFIYNELANFVMISAVVPEETIQPILAGLAPFFERHRGVMFVSDIEGSHARRRKADAIARDVPGADIESNAGEKRRARWLP